MTEATRIETILLRARDTLGDASGDRWTDAQLLRILDEGQKQIVMHANLLRNKQGQPIRSGVALYDMPEDCYKPIRILVKDIPLKMLSHEEMDRSVESGVVNTSSYSWEDTTGDVPECIVYDKLNAGTFKLYPIPEQAFSDLTFTLSPPGTVFGLLVSATDYVVTQTSGYLHSGQSYTTKTYVAGDDFSNVADIGALANVTGATWTSTGTTPTTWTNASTLSRDFGIAAFIDSEDYDQYYDLLGTLGIVQKEAYGLITMFEDASTEIMIYYLKRPADITSQTSGELIIGTTYKTSVYEAGDDFSNVADTGALANVTGASWTATGKTPTTWTNGSFVHVNSLEIDTFWDMYLKYFVCAMALQDNKDTQDRELAASQLQLFASGVQKARNDAMQDFTATKTQYIAPYNGGFLG